MRVLYFTDSWLPQVNGVSVVISMTTDGLRARGWDCEVVAPRYPSDRSRVRSDALTVSSVALPGYKDVRVAMPDYATVRKAIVKFRPDLVHCQTEFVVGRLGQFAAQQSGIPVVSSYHTEFERYCGAYGVRPLSLFVRRYLSRFHRRSVLTFAPSLHACESLRAMGVPRVMQWGRAVDATRFAPKLASSYLRTTLELGNAFTFLYVGRLAPEKSVELVLEAFRRVEARSSPRSVRLLIAGTGPLEEKLRKLATPSTIFLGQRRNDLAAIYASANAFVFASTTETLGLVALEAMASGLPVIATPEGGIGETLQHGENGLAFRKDDAESMASAMQLLATDKALHAKLKLGALNSASRLSWDEELDRLETCYQEIIAARALSSAMLPRETDALVGERFNEGDQIATLLGR